ncbi:MAG: hypothetical protein GY828_07085, partial [Candidatus Gracilibacteria bacterium]|nr:hypothetical protein [Candidatus Gracilibacteria bacterium]
MSGCEEIHNHVDINNPSPQEEFDRAFSTLADLDESGYPKEYSTVLQEKFEQCQRAQKKAEGEIVYETFSAKEELAEEVDVIVYFDIPNMKEFNELLSSANLNITPLLLEYKNFIESELMLPEGAHMTQQEHQNMIQNIKTLINSQIGELKKLEKKYESLEGMSIALNANIKESFQEFSKTVLTSAKFYIDMQ